MKKVFFGLSCALAFLGMTASAFALPPFKTEFDSMYKESDVAKTMKDLDGKGTDDEKAEKAKHCYVCHFGDSKKNRNDYGKALSTLLKKENFKKERFEKEADAAKKEIQDALKKVEAMKNAKGETFGDLIKAGKLPGTDGK